MRSLTYIIIMLIAAGCSCPSGKTATLDEAQQLLPDAPDIALERLNSIDVSEIHDSALMAHWALLYTEAMVANRLTAPTDTIINIAIDYYGAHNRHDELDRANKLKALITAKGNRDKLATALYLQKEKEFMLYKERTRTGQLLIIVIGVLLAAAAIIAWTFQRLKLKSAKNDILIAEASGLRGQIETMTHDKRRKENILQALLKERFALIDTLCQTYYESQGTRIERKAIAEKVKNEIEAVSHDAFPGMEHTVNQCSNQLLIRLKRIFPEIKPEDYRLATYLASGLSTRTISLLLDKPVDVIYKRKSRLKQRLTCKTDTADHDILDIFSN